MTRQEIDRETYNLTFETVINDLGNRVRKNDDLLKKMQKKIYEKIQKSNKKFKKIKIRR